MLNKYETAIATHYAHGSLLAAIETAVEASGKQRADLTHDDLAGVDEFHIGGRQATAHLMEQLNLKTEDHILDVGCGLGGAARFVAETYGCRVTGVDLTAEYVKVGNTLSRWVGLDDRVQLQQGNGLSLPFEDERFDGAYTIHVGMNVPEKAAFYAEIWRVLRPGSLLAVYDIMRLSPDLLRYPVPWAGDAQSCQMETPQGVRQALEQSGFGLVQETSRQQFAREFFKKVKAQNETAGPSPIGLQLLMQASTPEKIGNMVANLSDGLIAPVEMIARKP